MLKAKKLLKRFHEIIKKNYSIIFILIMFFSCIIKTVYSVGMFENPYHFEFDFTYGLDVMGPRIIILIMTYMVLFSFAFVFKNIIRYLYLVVIFVTSSIFCFMDLKYARFFQGPPSLFWTIMPHNSNNDVSMSWFVHFALTDLLYYADFILVGFMLIWGICKKRFVYGNTRLKLKLSTCMGSFVLLTIVSLAIPDETYLAQDTTKKVSCYGNFMYHMLDILQLSDYDKNIKMTSSDKKLYKSYEALLDKDEENSEDVYEDDIKGALNGSNLIVIQLEAIESFVLGNTINGKEITPFLNSLTGNSVQMNTYEQVRTGNSSDCDLMFMTSQYPVSRVISFNQFPKSEYLSIAEVLKMDGYKTMYFNSSFGSTWNYEGVMTTTMGFDEMHFGDEVEDDKVDRYNYHKIGGYIADELALNHVYDLITGESDYKQTGAYTTDDKFYAHMVLCSSHLPFVLPKELDQDFLNDKKLKNEIGVDMYNYISLTHYIDECIRLFVEKLEAKGLMDNTTLLIMGDHGGIHKYMSQHTSKLTECKEKYNWMTKASNYTVLTLIYNKNLDHRYVIGDNNNSSNYNMIEMRPDLKYHIDKKCAQVDVMPTLAYMYGVKDNFKIDGVSTLMGRNMFKTNLSYAIMANEKVRGNIPSEYKKLRRAQYISNALIKSEYFNDFDYVK